MRSSGVRGYSGYRGRRTGKKSRLAIVLLLVIFASLAFYFVQRYRVYHSDGTSHYEIPWLRRNSAEGDVPEQELEIVIEAPDGSRTVAKGG